MLGIDELKQALRTLLERKLNSLKREDWARKTSSNPLYRQSRELARFMILAAANKARPSNASPGTWTRKDYRPGHIYDFLNFKTWRDKRYATVEHVAPPDMPKTGGWRRELYHDNLLRDRLGNLILLPQKENSALGNSSWEKKRKFYLALTETSKSDQDKRIQEARAAGIDISEDTIKLLENGPSLSLLNPLRDVEHWKQDVVARRGINIAEQCWDIVWPWLQ